MYVQHTPVVTVLAGQKLISHNLVPKFGKKFPLMGLGEEVSDHFGSGAVLDVQITFFNLVGQKEITNVNCTSSLAGTFLTIFQ